MNYICTIFTLVLLGLFSADAFAQENGADSAERRLELAKQMQDIRPAKDQVDAAIDQYIGGLPEKERPVYKAALQSILNYKALEKISIDAYAETFTVAELEAMVEYYSKPEARSASDKSKDYAKLVYPEIIRMLDKAMMRVKTGSGTP